MKIQKKNCDFPHMLNTFLKSFSHEKHFKSKEAEKFT